LALTDLPSELDRDTVVQGAAIGVLMVGPLAGLSVWLVDTDGDGSGGLAAAFFLGILVAFVVVGWFTGRTASRVPLTHGAVAALSAFVIVQVTILLMAVVAGRDTDPSIIGLIFGGLLAAAAGTTGALVSQRRPGRNLS
jgi:hypothetical protein